VIAQKQKKKPRNTKGKKKKKKKVTFAPFVYRLLKSLDGKGISNAAMAVMCDLIQDMEQRILSEAINLCKVHKRATLTAREIQTAARIVLPGELALHAVSEGTKSITKYNAGLVPRKMLTISSFNPSDQQELLTKDSMKQGEAVDSVAPEIEQIIKPEKKNRLQIFQYHLKMTKTNH